MISEWTLPIAQLNVFRAQVALASVRHLQPGIDLTPGTDQCRYCINKAECPQLRAAVMEQFDNVDPITANGDDLANAFAKVDLFEGWLKAIRTEVQTRLMAGIPVRGYKIVRGRRGNRTWSNSAEVESLFKSMRLNLEEMYDMALISPASADKLLKAGTLGPKQWAKVKAFITQAEGSPSIVPDSDKRPALVMSAVASDFDDMTIPEPDLS